MTVCRHGNARKNMLLEKLFPWLKRKDANDLAIAADPGNPLKGRK